MILDPFERLFSARHFVDFDVCRLPVVVVVGAASTCEGEVRARRDKTVLSVMYFIVCDVVLTGRRQVYDRCEEGRGGTYMTDKGSSERTSVQGVGNGRNESGSERRRALCVRECGNFRRRESTSRCNRSLFFKWRPYGQQSRSDFASWVGFPLSP